MLFHRMSALVRCHWWLGRGGTGLQKGIREMEENSTKFVFLLCRMKQWNVKIHNLCDTTRNPQHRLKKVQAHINCS
jgi:hypothetical protein